MRTRVRAFVFGYIRSSEQISMSLSPIIVLSKRIKGIAETRMCTSEESKFFVEKTYWFKSGDLEIKFSKSEDCPKPDPNDTNDALESALHHQTWGQCQVQVQVAQQGRILCTLQVCSPSPEDRNTSKVNGSILETIADTGSEEDLIRNSDLEVHFNQHVKTIPSNTVSLITADGPVEADT